MTKGEASGVSVMVADGVKLGARVKVTVGAAVGATVCDGSGVGEGSTIIVGKSSSETSGTDVSWQAAARISIIRVKIWLNGRFISVLG